MEEPADDPQKKGGPHLHPTSLVENDVEFLRRIAKQYWLQEHDHDRLLKVADNIEFKNV
jgi:hypothetical protein